MRAASCEFPAPASASCILPLTSTQTSRPSAARTPRCTWPACWRRRRPAAPAAGCSCPSRSAVSQSRTNCLSNDGWPRPGLYSSAGQNRELSGVSTSSIRISSSSTRPNSNFVSAMMMPRLVRVLGAARVELEAPLRRAASASSRPTRAHISSNEMLSSCCLARPWWPA